MFIDNRCSIDPEKYEGHWQARITEDRRKSAFRGEPPLPKIPIFSDVWYLETVNAAFYFYGYRGRLSQTTIFHGVNFDLWKELQYLHLSRKKKNNVGRYRTKKSNTHQMQKLRMYWVGRSPVVENKPEKNKIKNERLIRNTGWGLQEHNKC